MSTIRSAVGEAAAIGFVVAAHLYWKQVVVMSPVGPVVAAETD